MNDRDTTIIIIGDIEGEYKNEDVEKTFECFGLILVRKNGSVIVQNLNQGIRPICYIGDGAEVSISHNSTEGIIVLESATNDFQYLKMNITDLITSHNTEKDRCVLIGGESND